MNINKKYLKYRKVYKNRRFKKFYIFYPINNSIRLIALQDLKLFIKHIKIIEFLIRRSTRRLNIITRKEKFKQINKKIGITATQLKYYDLINKKYKNVFSYLSWIELLNVSFFLNKFHSFQFSSIIYLNLNFLPYTKKSAGSRMGTGTGSLKDWFLNISIGMPILSFFFWPLNKLKYLLLQLNNYLPGKYSYNSLGTISKNNNIYSLFIQNYKF